MSKRLLFGFSIALDVVIARRLNYYRRGKYDFNGGWGNRGTEIFLPLSPKHLLYTKVGEKPASRGTVVDRPQAQELRRQLAEHAHRMIFADTPDARVSVLRPRHEDAEAFDEREAALDAVVSEAVFA